MNNKPMLNAYPDSLGGKLSDIAALLKKKEMQDTFSSFYILPSLYHSDLDRGFSVVDYNLNEELATIEDLSQLKELGIDLKLDFILNHASAQSPQFKDLVEKGDESEYRDFFIDWNKFWALLFLNVFDIFLISIIPYSTSVSLISKSAGASSGTRSFFSR